MAATADPARQAAESYLGRPMSDTEYKQLLNATYAEADPGSATEAAMVAASILNRAAQGGQTITQVLYAPNQFESVTGTPGNRQPSSNFVQGPPASTLGFIQNAMTTVMPNVSRQQTDFTAAQPAAYAGPGHDLNYFHQAQANYNRVGGSLFNTAPPDGSAPVQTASFTPPTPNLRPDGPPPSLYAGGGLNGGFGTPQVQQASYQQPAPSPLLGFTGQAPSQSSPADAALNQRGADVLGGGNSPLHQYSVFEPNTVPSGPYGADAVVRAALSGDPKALQSALDNVMGTALQTEGLLGIGKAQSTLQGYFDTVQQQAPGAIRAVQSQLQSNPALNAVVPAQMRPMLDQAFGNLPPPSTGSVAMPNLRPSNGPATSTPPLVAAAAPPVNAPQMAAYTPPQPTKTAASWLPPSLKGTQEAPPSGTPSLGDAWTAMKGLIPGLPGLPFGASDPASDTSGQQPADPGFNPFDNWTPPKTTVQNERTAQLLNYPSQPGSGFSQSFAPPPAVSVKPPANSTSAGNALLGMGSALPSSTFTPKPIGLSPANSFLMGPMPGLTPDASAFGVAPASAPKPQTATIAAAPQPAPPPPPPPMTPQQAFEQQAGPAPQNVNWQQTLADDPYAQPGTENTYVLNDMDAKGQNNYAASTVLCTYFHKKGWLSRRLWVADTRFAGTLPKRWRRGYLRWAVPTVRRLERGSPILELMLWLFVVRPWATFAEAMLRHKKRPLTGAFVHWALGSLCWALGKET